MTNEEKDSIAKLTILAQMIDTESATFHQILSGEQKMAYGRMLWSLKLFLDKMKKGYTEDVEEILDRVAGEMMEVLEYAWNCDLSCEEIISYLEKQNADQIRNQEG